MQGSGCGARPLPEAEDSDDPVVPEGAVVRHQQHPIRRPYMKRKLDQNLSGNEVYYTECSLRVILKNSCIQLHCHKGFNLILFSCKT